MPKEVSASTIPDSALSLLAVNKQVNSEAFGIFYYFNAFEFYYPTQLHAFLLSIGKMALLLANVIDCVLTLMFQAKVDRSIFEI